MRGREGKWAFLVKKKFLQNPVVTTIDRGDEIHHSNAQSTNGFMIEKLEKGISWTPIFLCV